MNNFLKRITLQFVDKKYLVSLILIPLICLAVFIPILNFSQSPILGIINNDKGTNIKGTNENIPSLLISALNSENLIKVKAETLSQAQTDLKNHQIIGYVEFPKNFTSALYNNQSLKLHVYIENNYPQVTSEISTMVNYFFIDPTKFANVLEVDYLYPNQNISPNLIFVIAAILIITIIFASLLTFVLFSKESKNGKILRLIGSGYSPFRLLNEYFLSYLAVFLVTCLFLTGFAFAFLHFQILGDILSVVIITLLILAFSILLSMFISLLTNNSLNGVSAVLGLLFIQIGLLNVFYPLSQFNIVVQHVFTYTPLNTAYNALIGVIADKRPLRDFAINISALLIYCVIAYLLTYLIFRLREKA